MEIFSLSTAAWAAGAQAGGGLQRWGGFITLIFIFVIFYFLLILPQQKRQKQHKKMIGALRKGDEVVTMGGVHGTIVQMAEDTVVLRVDKDKDIRITVSKSAVATVKGKKEQ
jgi:preprotein translocase subunit YajC